MRSGRGRGGERGARGRGGGGGGGGGGRLRLTEEEQTITGPNEVVRVITLYYHNIYMLETKGQ